MQQTTCPNCGEVVNVLPGDINGNMQLDAHTRPAMAGNVQCTGSFRLIGRVRADTARRLTEYRADCANAAHAGYPIAHAVECATGGGTFYGVVAAQLDLCTCWPRIMPREERTPYWWSTPDLLDEQARTSARSLAALAEMVRAWTTDGLGAPNAETLSTLAVAIQSHADGLLAALPPES